MFNAVKSSNCSNSFGHGTNKCNEMSLPNTLLYYPIVLIAIFSGTNKINTCRVYTFIVDLVLVVCCTLVQCRICECQFDTDLAQFI